MASFFLEGGKSLVVIGQAVGDYNVYLRFEICIWFYEVVWAERWTVLLILILIKLKLLVFAGF